MADLKNDLIDIASGKNPADLVIKNVNVVNVFSGKIVYGSLAIHKGIIIEPALMRAAPRLMAEDALFCLA